MTGKLNEPGVLTVTYLDTDDPHTFNVQSGPWCYAEWLCWRPTDDPNLTTYAPLVNVATWSKVPQQPNNEGAQ